MDMDIDICVGMLRELAKIWADSEHLQLAELAALVEYMFIWLDHGGPLPACWGE